MKFRNFGRWQMLGAALLAMAVHAAAIASQPPVYIHMNCANMFLEGVVAVRTGQPVVFLNEDTGAHTIIGYDPLSGRTSKVFNGYVAGTKGPNSKVPGYSVRFDKSGLQYYYCSVHAVLMKQMPESLTAAKICPGVDGFGTAMAGLIIVTTDPALLAQNPPTTRQKILPDYFGG